MVNICPGLIFLPVFHKDPSLAPFCFLFIAMIYLMVFNVTQNYFADDTSLFATVHNIMKATNNFNINLIEVTKWAFQWKASFNTDISKQALFCRKRSIAFHLLLTFNNIPVTQINSQKHLGIQLDEELNFEEHLNKVESKVNKTIGIICEL